MSALWYPLFSSSLPRLRRLPRRPRLSRFPRLTPRIVALARLALFGLTLLVAGMPVSDALAVTSHHSGHGKRHLQPAKHKKMAAKTTSKPARRKATAARAPHHRSAHHRAKTHAGRKAAKPARRAQTTVKHRANATRQHATPKVSRAAGAVRTAGAVTNATARVHTAAKPRLLARCGFTPASRKRLFSRAVYIVDENTKTPLFSLNANQVRPIASLSKLMTAVVWLDSGPAMRAPLTVTNADLDTLKFSHSRLAVGSTLSRADMLHISLMASENRAAAALSRDYPGGRPAFISAMNRKARALNMPNTRFANSTGLSPNNVSTARELARLVRASNAYPLIRRYSIDHQQRVNTGKGQLQYVNTNRLVRYGKVDASVQKTGFINESGHNMVMRVLVHKRRPVIVTMLGSDTPEGSRLDGVRIAHWLSCSLR